MLSIALKMLIGNKASCIGVIFGIFLATLLISQQSAIFLGLVSRSYRIVTDISEPNIWVVDPATESDEKVRAMPTAYLNDVKSTPEVEWAVPINVMDLPMVTPSGVYQIAHIYGIDDATLIGAPTTMLEGNVIDLHREGSVIVDTYSANGSLARILPDGTTRPLAIGDTFEINQHHAVVVGISKVTQGFIPQPIIYTTNSNFNYFSSYARSSLAFIAAKTKPGANVDNVLKKINANTMLEGMTSDDLKWRIARFFLKTGILINFGLSVALGIIIGFSIAGQIFYIMTLQNLQYYALIKAIGGNQKQISQMIIIQSLVVGLIGFLLGTGATILWGFAIKDTTLAFLFPWQLLAFTGTLVLIICTFTAGLSIEKISKIDPKVLLGN